ncbi:MAG TPA: GNAT family N-acetyltransferase [Pirellulaceae bacterium]|nr:GNAT family N-acetyltransferase [Pirellulaceae bacterium]
MERVPAIAASTLAPIAIRESTPADLAALRTLFLDARRATFPWRPQQDWTLEDFDRSTEGELVLVATIEGRIVGFVSWWAPDNFVHNLFVAPDRLRFGIGGRLLGAALARMGRPAWLKCDRRNENAIGFYLANGWEPYEERVELGADWLPLVMRS